MRGFACIYQEVNAIPPFLQIKNEIYSVLMNKQIMNVICYTDTLRSTSLSFLERSKIILT